MPTSSFPTLVTGVTVDTATNGGLSGDGSSGNKLAVDTSAFASGLLPFASGDGLSLAGAGAHPMTLTGGNDGSGDSAIIIDNPGDSYAVMKYNQFTDTYYPAGARFFGQNAIELDFFSTSVNIQSETNTFISLDTSAHQATLQADTVVLQDSTAASLVSVTLSNIALTNPTAIDLTAPIINVAGKQLAANTIASLAANTDTYDSKISATYNATNGSPTTSNFNAHQNDIVVGPGAIGTISSYVGTIHVNGSGDAGNTFSNFHQVLEANIGTGFTQTIGPVGNLFFADWQVYGSVAVQPANLQGLSLLMQNQYNGSPSSAGSAGMTFITKKGLGDGSGAHATADTFATDYALQIRGYSTASAVDGIGWTKGIEIGGSGSIWGESKSIIGTGIHIRDHKTYGILIDNQNDATAPDLSCTGFIEGFEMSAPAAGAANSFRLFAVDNGGGKTVLKVIFNSGAAQVLATQP